MTYFLRKTKGNDFDYLPNYEIFCKTSSERTEPLTEDDKTALCKGMNLRLITGRDEPINCAFAKGRDILQKWRQHPDAKKINPQDIGDDMLDPSELAALKLISFKDVKEHTQDAKKGSIDSLKDTDRDRQECILTMMDYNSAAVTVIHKETNKVCFVTKHRRKIDENVKQEDGASNEYFDYHGGDDKEDIITYN